MSVVIPYIVYFLLLTLVKGRSKDGSMLPLNDVMKTSPSAKATDEQFETFNTESHQSAQTTQSLDKCQIFNICHKDPLKPNETQKPEEQLTLEAEDLTKIPSSQLSTCPTEADDRQTNNVTSSYHRKSAVQFKENNFIILTTQSVSQEKETKSVAKIHTPASSSSLLVMMNQTTTKSRPTHSTLGIKPTTQPLSSASKTSPPSSENGEDGPHKCQEKLEEFVSALKLCERDDSGDSSTSCMGRCGQVQSFDHSFDNCSCDTKCSVYHDCCVDFYIHCTDTWTQSLQLFGEKIYSYKSHSHHSQVRAIYDCANSRQQSVTFSTDFFTSETTPYFFSPSSRLSGLDRLIFSNKLVADLSTGLIYTNVDSYYFNCHNRSSPDPYIIPLVLPLRGKYTDDQSIESYVFPLDFLHMYSPYIFDPFPTMRGYFRGETVNCGSCQEQKVNYFCSYKMAPVGSQRPTDDGDHVFVPASSPLNQHGNCSHWPIYDKKGQSFWQTFAEKVLNKPPIANYTWTSARQILEAQWPDLVGWVTIRRWLREKELILEFTGVPWTKMKCSHSRMPLDYCQILQCSRGYFLTKSGKCILPDSVVMAAEVIDSNITSGQPYNPICQCLSAHKALKKSKIFLYSLGKIHLDQNGCRFDVTGVSDRLLSGQGERASDYLGNGIPGTRSDINGMIDNAHQNFVNNLRSERKGEVTTDGFDRTADLKNAVLEGLVQSRDDCAEKVSLVKICFGIGSSESKALLDTELQCFSFSHDHIYTDNSQDETTPANLPPASSTSAVDCIHHCEPKLKLQLMAVLVVYFHVIPNDICIIS